MCANPVANGGALLRDLRLPDFRAHAVDVLHPDLATAEAERAMGGFVRDVMRAIRPRPRQHADAT